MARKKKKKTFVQKAIKFILIFLIILLVCLGAIVAGGWTYINNKLGTIGREQIDITQIGIENNTNERLKDFRNIALLGIDSRADDYGLGNRSDCIIIASINEKTNDVKLISIYRDTFLQVMESGTPRLDKVTHAYAYGGAQNTLLALNSNLDLNIKEFITVNFDAVISAVDSLNGISINIDSQELKYINDYIDELIRTSGISSNHITKTGTQTLDGVQAVAYSRIRYTDGGDYKRTERMRTVIEAMVNKAKTLSVSKLDSLVTTMLPKISTNMSNSDILSLVPTLFKVNFTDSLGWPYDTKGITLDRWYGIPVTLESNVVQMHKEIFGISDYVLPDKIKQISDQIINRTGYNN